MLDEKLNSVTSAVNTLSTDVMARLDELKADMDALKQKVGVKTTEE